MKWVLIIGLLLIVIVGVVAIIGSLLPRDHVATLSARIAGAPDDKIPRQLSITGARPTSAGHPGCTHATGTRRAHSTSIAT